MRAASCAALMALVADDNAKQQAIKAGCVSTLVDLVMEVCVS